MKGTEVPGKATSKRARTRDRLLANAVALFRAQGVRATRLAEVASASEMAPATLYNHFPTKGALAEAWVRGEVVGQTAAAARRAVDENRGLRSVIRSVCATLAREGAEEPGLRLEAWREAGRAPTAESCERDALVMALAEEQKREHVRADLAAEWLAELLVDAIEGGLVSGLTVLAEGSASVGDAARLEAAIRARVDLVLDGARKRNERVRPPAPSR